jgi:hypothetical protein
MDTNVPNRAIGSRAGIAVRNAKANAYAAQLAPYVAALRAEGIVSHSGIARAFTRLEILTRTGSESWTATGVRRMLARLPEAVAIKGSYAFDARNNVPVRTFRTQARAKAYLKRLTPIVMELRAGGAISAAALAQALTERGLRSPSGGTTWSMSTVRRLLARLATAAS